MHDFHDQNHNFRYKQGWYVSSFACKLQSERYIERYFQYYIIKVLNYIGVMEPEKIRDGKLSQ